jgi:hypothetical protein
MSLNENCNIEINLFGKNFYINQLNDIFPDVSIAYESILAINIVIEHKSKRVKK